MQNLQISNIVPDVLLEDNSIAIYWKDKKGTWLGLNDYCVQAIPHSQSCDEIIGNTDFDLFQEKDATIFRKNDQEIISTGYSKTNIEPVHYDDGKVTLFLAHKTPLLAKRGTISGVYGISVALNNIIPMFDSLDNLGFLEKIKTLNSLQSFSKKIQTAGLTKRQADCLSLLMRGMTVKQIATTLILSPRTVEHYLDIIKLKMYCSSRTELIDKILN